MYALIWHIFIVVWGTGVVGFVGVRVYSSPNRELDRRVDRQIKETRLAELQARERKALGTNVN